MSLANRPEHRSRRPLLLERLEQRILLNAVPDVTLDVPDDALIGETVDFQITFDMPATATGPGFGPFIDLVLPRDGADGAMGTDTPDGIGTDANGVTFDFFGSPLSPVFDEIVDASGTVEHPLLKNPDGSPVILTNLRPGDRFIVLQLPFGSYQPENTELVINASANLDGFADLGVALPIQARGGFQFGCDPLDNPSVDNPNDTVSAFMTDFVTPEVVLIDKVVIAPEGETATGENFKRTYAINLDVATGQEVTDVIVNDPLSNRIVYRNTVVQGGGSPDAGSGIITDQPMVNVGPMNNTNLTVEYAKVEGVDDTDISVSFEFHVPENDADGNPIIPPTSGSSTTTQNSASATYTWQPLDPRDSQVTTTVEDPLDGSNQTLTNKSIAIQKGVAIVGDIGPAGASPGDTLEYRLDFQVSDYFDFQDVVINDLLSDGQSLDPNFIPQLVIFGNGLESSNLGDFDAANFSSNTQTVSPYGIELEFRVSNELQSRMLSGNLVGNDGSSPGTTGTIVFRTTIDDQFRDPTLSPEQRSVDEGDTVTNTVEISANLLGTMQPVTDGSNASTSIPTGEIDKSVVAVNDLPFIGDPVAGPGDTVTYRIAYTLPLTRFESLKLGDTLPVPVFDADSITTFNNSIQSSGVPAVGEIAYGPSAQAFFDLYSVGANLTPSLSIDSASNSFELDFGTFSAAVPETTTIELLFTVEFADFPFADGLFLSNLVESTQGTTNSGDIEKADIAIIESQTPELNLKKGVVSTDAPAPPADFTPDPTGPVMFENPGNTGPAFTMPITSAGLLNNPIDSNLMNIDAGDLVKFAIVIENTGSDDGFDLVINDTLPPGFVVPTSGELLNLQVSTGDRRALDFTDADGIAINPGDEADFFFVGQSDGRGIRIVDPADSAGGNPIDGAIDGLPSGGATGSNIIVVTFDLMAASDIEAGSEQIDIGELARFGAVNNGTNWTTGVDGPFKDDAIVTAKIPEIEKVLVRTEFETATNTRTQAVIGELATYDIIVTIPEGVTNRVLVTDDFSQLPTNMAFVSLDGVTPSGFLSTDLMGGFGAVTPSVGPDGTTVSFDLGTITNSANSNGASETIVLTVTGVVLNVSDNQTTVEQRNAADVAFEVAGQTQTVSTTSDPVTVIEPDLRVAKSVTVNGQTGSSATGDAGDPVEYRIAIRHSGQSETDAYDFTLTDILPTKVINYVIATVSDTANVLTTNDFAIVNGTLQIALGNDPTQNEVDVPLNREIVVTLTGVIADNVVPNELIVNQADIDWTSLNGDLGARSMFNTDSVERTGDQGPNGALNDYAHRNRARFRVTAEVFEKTIVATSESHTADLNGTEQVAIGEIVRYRLVTTVPEATYIGTYLQDLMPDGLTYLDDGTTKVAFVGDDFTQFTASAFDPNDYAMDVFVIGDENTVNSVVPTYVLSGDLISASPGNPNDDLFLPGTDPYFFFENVINLENDANQEFIVLEFNALVNNVAGNQEGDTRDNSFTATFRNQAGNPPVSDPVTVQIVEPQLNVVKLIDTAPVDAGDEIVYTIEITNNNSDVTTTAFDINLLDALDSNLDLTSVSVLSAPAGTMVLDNSDTGAGNSVDLTFDRLAKGETIEVEVRANVIDTASVGRTIANTADITYTSLPDERGTANNPTGSQLPAGTTGDPGNIDGERTGSNVGANDYLDTSSVSTTLATPMVEKLVDPSTYTIGEIVSYEIVVTLNEGITEDLQFTDNLPVGLEYVGFTLVTDQALSNGLLTEDYEGNLSIQSVNNPTGSGTDLVIEFGDTLTTADGNADNDAFVVLVDARVLNESNNQDGDTLVNVGEVRYENPNNGQEALTTGQVSVSLVEPVVDIQKTGPQPPVTPDAGDLIQYTVVLEHNSTSSSDAFEVEFVDIAPTNTIITRVVSFNATGFGGGTQPLPEIVPGGGSIVLSDVPGSGEFDLPLNARITLVYEVMVQDTVGPGEVLTNDAQIDWSSLDGNVNPGQFRGERDGSDRPDVNGLNNYFDGDQVSITTATPDIAKDLIDSTVMETMDPDLVVGEQARFFLTVTLPEATYPSPVVITDNLPELPGKLELVSAVYRADLSDSNVTFSNLDISGDDTNNDMLLDQATFTFTDLVNPSATGTNDNVLVFEIIAVVPDDSTTVNGQTLTNTASLTYTGFFADDTADVKIVEPVLIIEKTSPTTTGSSGDEVTYTLEVKHDQTQSTAAAFDIVIDDQLLDGLGTGDKLDLVVGSVTTSSGTITSGNMANDTTVTVEIDSLALNETVIVTFKAILNDNVDPTGDQVVNTSVVDYDSLPGPGGRTGDDRDTHEVTTPQEEVEITKTVIRTSEPTTDSSQFDPTIEDLAIGEVVTYQITLDLPPGTYNDPVVVTDQLPEFLALVNGDMDVRVVGTGSDVDLSSAIIVTGDSGTDGYDDQLMVTLNLNSVAIPDPATQPDNQVTIEVDALVLNVQGNQQTGAPLTNTATVAFGQFTDSDSVDVELVEPTLDLTKQILSQSADPPAAGDTITYQITIDHTNVSQADALGVVFLDVAPSDTLITNVNLVTASGFVTAPNPEITGSGTGIRLNGSSPGEFDMPLGASIVLEYTLTLQDTVEHNQVLINDASLKWTSLTGDVSPGAETGERDGSGDPAPNSLNNYFDNEQVSETVGGFLSLDKTVLNGTDFAIGDTVEYQLEIGLFEGTTTQLVITDDVPTQFTVDVSTVKITSGNNFSFASTPQITFSGGILQIELGDVVNAGNNDPNDDTFLIEYDAVVINDQANQNNDVKTNIANAVSTNSLQDRVEASVDIVEPFLLIDKTINDDTPHLGDVVTYQFLITHDTLGANPSTTDAYDLIIRDMLPPEVSVIPMTISITAPAGTVVNDSSAGNNIDILVDRLALNESITITFDATVTQDINDYGTTFENTVNLDWDSQPGMNPEERMDNTNDRQTATIVGPDLAIQKDTLEESLLPGQIFDYSIVVTNKTGPFADVATDAVIVDQLPAGLTFLGTTSPFFQGYNPTLGQVTWLIPNLAIGQVVTLDMEVQLSDPAPPTEVIENEVEVTHNDIDPTPIDNKDKERTPIDPSAVPDLVVTKDDGEVQVFPGDVLTYDIVVTNVGNQDAKGVIVTDVFPKDVLSFIDASNGGVYDASTGIVTWDLGVLGGRGDQVTLTLTGQVLFSVVDPTIMEFTNLVKVMDDGTLGPDPTPENNMDTDTDRVLFYGTDAFNNFLDEPDRFNARRFLDPLPAASETFLTGIADPGTTLFLEVHDGSGQVIGWRTVVADSGGNYIANFQDVNVDQGVHSTRAHQTMAGFNRNDYAGFNLRRYYEPAGNAASYFSLAPSQSGAFRDAPSQVLFSMQESDERPLQLTNGLTLAAYQSRISSVLPAAK